MYQERLMYCTFCGAKVELEDKVMRSDTCPQCSRDLRCCKQCQFFDHHAYNECKEVMAERIQDKERANFCEYYTPRGNIKKAVNRNDDAKAALEALFKKKS